MALGNLGPSEVQQYLEGVDYPADKETVASTAESNGAPRSLWTRSAAWEVTGSPARMTSYRRCR